MWLFYVLIDYYWALHEYKIKFGRGINLTGYDFLTSASCGSQNTGVALIGNMSETVFNLSFIKCLGSEVYKYARKIVNCITNHR